MTIAMGMRIQLYSWLAMLPPRKLPTGIKPTFTPIRKTASPMYTYTSPMTMCRSSFFLSRLVTSWNSTRNAPIGSRAEAVSFM